MERPAMRKYRKWRAAVSIGLVLGATAVVWGLQSGGEPILFRPNPARKDVSLPRGEVLLFQFLQGVADSTGVAVCYKGDDPPETTIALPRALEKPDSKTAAEVLEKNGYELSSAELRGKTVSWVQRLIVPVRTKGKILRGGEKKEGADPGETTAEARGPAAPAGDSRAPSAGRLGLYTLESGNGARFVVSFETESRKDAEEALSLLKAHRQSRLTGNPK